MKQPIDLGQDVAPPQSALQETGQLLRLARERLGLSQQELSAQLHAPLQVIADLEQGDVGRLGAPVYVVGYLRAYGKRVALPEEQLACAVQALHDQIPALQASPAARRKPMWSMRWVNRAAYTALTAFIVLPVVFLTHGGLGRAPARLAADAQAPAATPNSAVGADGASVVAIPITGAVSPDSTDAQDAALQTLKVAEADPVRAVVPGLAQDADGPIPTPPLMASMAPLPAPHAAVASWRLRLELRAASWVQLIGAQGERLEYGLLPAGTTREYSGSNVAHLKIGNARAAQLQIDGVAVDLAPYTYSNVANVALGDAAANR